MASSTTTKLILYPVWTCAMYNSPKSLKCYSKHLIASLHFFASQPTNHSWHHGKAKAYNCVIVSVYYGRFTTCKHNPKCFNKRAKAYKYVVTLKHLKSVHSFPRAHHPTYRKLKNALDKYKIMRDQVVLNPVLIIQMLSFLNIICLMFSKENTVIVQLAM